MLWPKHDSQPLGVQLGQKVWRVENAGQDHWSERSGAYVSHFKNLTSAGALYLGGSGRTIKLEDVFHLVEFVREGAFQKRTICDMKRRLENSSIPVLKASSRLGEADKAIEFAIRLWLFVTPPQQKLESTIYEALRQALPSKASILPSTSAAAKTILSEDFCAKSLTRKGGFHLIWTSDLAEHLLIRGDDHLHIFVHATILKRYQRSEERTLYPEGLLEEVERTVDLLFPTGNFKSVERVRKISRKQKVDIEAYRVDDRIMKVAKYQCSSYPFYGERLAKIQSRYNKARPHTLTQWWFDRRNPREWAALWIAVVVFILTVFFGVISAVTGCMQVYASFHSEP